MTPTMTGVPIVAEAVPAQVDLVTARAAAVQAIMQEVGCTEALASSTVDWIAVQVAQARTAQYHTAFPTATAMAQPEYRVFDQVMQHDATAQPGSAHEAIQAALLDLSRNETTLLHTDRADAPDSPRYCQVQIGVQVF